MVNALARRVMFENQGLDLVKGPAMLQLHGVQRQLINAGAVRPRIPIRPDAVRAYAVASGRQQPCGCETSPRFNWLPMNGGVSSARSIYVTRNQKVVDVPDPEEIDFTTIGLTHELADLIKDVNRNGGPVENVTTKAVAGTTVTFSSTFASTTDRIVGFRLKFSSTLDNSELQSLDLETSGFESFGGKALDRSFSSLDIDMQSFEMYVLFGSYLRTPQDVHSAIATTANPATVTVSNVGSSYTGSLQLKYLAANSGALSALCRAIGVRNG